jgi:hypothetical protein
MKWLVTHTHTLLPLKELVSRLSQDSLPNRMRTMAFQVSKTNTLNINLINNLDNDEEDGGGAGGDSNAESVIDLVDAHRLKEITLDKKGWMAYIKGIYLVYKLMILFRVCQEGEGKP